MSDKLIKDVPAHILVYLFVSGLFVLLLTPFYTTLPAWVNPLTQKIPSEALASVALATIISFLLGIPGLLLRNFIIGNRSWIAILKGTKSSEQDSLGKVSFDRNRAIYNDKSLLDFIAFFAIKYQIVSGIIVGSEIAFFFNFFIVPLALITGNSLGDLNQFSYTTYLLATMMTGVIAWAYDKFYFRKMTKKLEKVVDQCILKKPENSNSTTEHSKRELSPLQEDKR